MLPVTIALASLGQQLALLAAFGRRYVSEDQALLWAAARDMGRLQLRQPNFWGQAYGVTFEAAPAELLRRFGLGYPTGLPLAVIGLNLLAWWLPALAAWHRGRRVMATAAVAVPLVLSLEHGLLSVVYNTAFGRTLAGAAAALVIWRPDRRATVGAAIALGGLAVLVDASCAVIVVPVLVGLAARHGNARAVRRMVPAAALGAAPVAAWWAFTEWWYGRHPDDSLHPSPALRPSWEVLTDNLAHPSRHFATFAPELWRSPVVAVGCVVVVAGLAVRRRDGWAAIAVAAMTGLVVLALSLPRSRDGLPTIYYPASRVLMSFPFALWWCATTLRSSRPAEGFDERPGARTRRVLGAVAIGIVVASIGVRAVTWDHRLGSIRDQAVAFENYPLTATPTLVGRCDRVGGIATERGITTVLFDLRTEAYACAGVFGAEPATLYPPYERRAWVLRAADRPGPAELLVVGPTPVTCEAAGLACTPLGRDAGDTPGTELTVVALAGESPLAAARRLGVPVRAFETDP